MGATPASARMMFAARMSWGTVSHARGMVVVVAEMHATHQAASAASHLGWRKPGGTQSPRPPSALGEQARSSAAMFCNACMAEQLTDRKRRGGLGSPTLRLARVEWLPSL